MTIVKQISLALLLILSAMTLAGQQEAGYTQYLSNLQTVNPAYAGSWKTIGFTGLTRIQWTGIEGHPVTHTFSFQAPLRQRKIGAGLNLISDKVGLEKRLTLSLDYSYEIGIWKQITLRMGLCGGFTNLGHNLGEYTQYPDGQDDPAFQIMVRNRFMPNFGVGFFLSSPKYYLSLSLPKIIDNKYTSNANGFSTASGMRHFYLAGGMIWNVSDRVKFKPALMTQMVAGAPVVWDLSASFLLAEKVWAGALYRPGDAICTMVQWMIGRNMRIGYAHDFSTTDLRNYHHGVHEIMLSCEFLNLKAESLLPRYF